MRACLLPLLSLLGACIPESSILAPRCDLTLGAPSPATAAPGDAVVLAGQPLTSTYDTAVYVGGTRATVVEVLRDGCDDCDSCREEAECSVCGDCDACDQVCGDECVETISFLVPEASAGSAAVTVYNTHGVGGPVELEVLGGGSDDTGDSGDGGSPDGGADGGSPDGGTDGGSPDGGTDGGSPDGGADGGSPDGGADGGSPDGGADGGSPDGGEGGK